MYWVQGSCWSAFSEEFKQESGESAGERAEAKLARSSTRWSSSKEVSGRELGGGDQVLGDGTSQQFASTPRTMMTATAGHAVGERQPPPDPPDPASIVVRIASDKMRRLLFETTDLTPTERNTREWIVGASANRHVEERLPPPSKKLPMTPGDPLENVSEPSGLGVSKRCR